MGNGAQHAIATGVAAHLCMKYQTTPAGVYEQHLSELQSKAADITAPSIRQSRL